MCLSVCFYLFKGQPTIEQKQESAQNEKSKGAVSTRNGSAEGSRACIDEETKGYHKSTGVFEEAGDAEGEGAEKIEGVQATIS